MKIQVGRTYLDGEDTKCRIVEYDAGHSFPFTDEHGCRYLEDGVYRFGRGPEHPKLNLIREVADPEELREEIEGLRREVAELREALLELHRRIKNPNP